MKRLTFDFGFVIRSLGELLRLLPKIKIYREGKTEDRSLSMSKTTSVLIPVIEFLCLKNLMLTSNLA